MPNAQKQGNNGNIKEILPTILEIQELDMQMVQLMKLKRERQKELDNINKIKKELDNQGKVKEHKILELKTAIRMGEGELKDIKEKIKKLEEQQSSIKKVEEFNALSHEMSQADRERSAKENDLSELTDKLSAEEELLQEIGSNLESTVESSKVLENEIQEKIKQINTEGRDLKEKREKIAEKADPEVLGIYDRLLRNKKDCVVVPIENRCCSGCHIALTAQDENLVRKAERLVFCEHCSRILYWIEAQEAEASEETAKPRRRRSRTTS